VVSHPAQTTPLRSGEGARGVTGQYNRYDGELRVLINPAGRYKPFQ